MKFKYNDIASAPKCSSPIDLVITQLGRIIVIEKCTWSAPIDIDDNGDEYFCYDECDWWSEDDDCPGWVNGYGVSVIGWMPRKPDF